MSVFKGLSMEGRAARRYDGWGSSRTRRCRLARGRGVSARMRRVAVPLTGRRPLRRARRRRRVRGLRGARRGRRARVRVGVDSGRGSADASAWGRGRVWPPRQVGWGSRQQRCGPGRRRRATLCRNSRRRAARFPEANRASLIPRPRAPALQNRGFAGGALGLCRNPSPAASDSRRVLHPHLSVKAPRHADVAR
jgi:hypothetical protein